MNTALPATAASQPPAWLDRSEYPFTSRYFELPQGRMHYIDEGQGRPLVFVHGTPSWSFLYRHLIKGLASDYRCIAPDNLGFGLSDKSPELSYRPADLAANLRTLIEHLELQDITLVVHDFGGPIGLSYAIEQPENVRNLVLFNTWLWSQRGNRSIEGGSKLMGGPVGKWLYLTMNFESHVLIKLVMGDRPMTRHVRRHYTQPYPRKQDRYALWRFAGHMINESDWYDSLWQRRDRITDKPALLLWGGKDPFFKQGERDRLEQAFTNAQTVNFPTSGHFVQEERGAELVPLLRDFLAAH